MERVWTRWFGGALWHGVQVDLDREFGWEGHRVRWTSVGDGPPIVFCHGTPWSSRLWGPIAAALGPGYRVYLWDMPGYGQSSMEESADVSLGAQGRLLAALLDHWGLATPHVVAHDYGGAVALRAHLLHGARYASLALVDVVALAPWGSEFFRLVRDNAAVFAALPPPLHEALVTAYVRGASAQGLGSAAERMLVEPWLGVSGQGAFYRQIAQADQRYTDEVEPRYGELSIPVRVIWGEDDTWIPVDRAHRLAAMVPDAELELVPGAGHLIQLDTPEALTASLQRWIAACERADQ